jgi:hypothetical protein
MPNLGLEPEWADSTTGNLTIRAKLRLPLSSFNTMSCHHFILKIVILLVKLLPLWLVLERGATPSGVVDDW